MASTSVKPSFCYSCGKKGCQGVCSKCPIRLEENCKNMFVAKPMERRNGAIYYGWLCFDCLTKGE